MSKNPDLSKINDAAAKDILELRRRIDGLKSGVEQEERFKHYRLTRGVYGQRQLGVHMFRTKIPYGKLTAQQLTRLADVSEKYTNGNLHLTTRQNIQFHYVKLDDAPAIWTELSEVGVTAREACGNTVRNLTGSAIAGIDPEELFDVTPYVHTVFEYFLRNPICQDMGRKIKPAFSSSDRDSAYTYFHDFGFIPRIKEIDGKEVRGFKLVVAGGLGAQSIVAQTAYEFIAADEIIPFMEAAIRVFDRYGEREKRFKARMKFLVKALGLEGFLELVEEERKAIKYQVYPIEAWDANPVSAHEERRLGARASANEEKPHDVIRYENWLNTNVFEQKQKGWYAVKVKVRLGDIDAERARRFAKIVETYAADDIRISVNQGFVIKFLDYADLPAVFNALDAIGLGDAGFDTIADITACPGTDTCNLAVTNSTGLSNILEEVITTEYPNLISESDIKIKISGCMNSCGQHMAANIGFHGSSIKKKALVIPAMQIVLGGGVDDSGKGFIAEKIIKLPTKKIPDALRAILNDYEDNGHPNEYFNDYYQRFGKRYFYDLIKNLADVNQLAESDFFDWGQDKDYVQAIGVGECAGVAYDVVGTIISDAVEKIDFAKEAFEKGIYADSIYHIYSAQVVGAKALLLSKDIKCNTHSGIIKDFDEAYVKEGQFQLATDFATQVLQINKNEPSELFAKAYLGQGAAFVQQVIDVRKEQFGDDGNQQQVIDTYYKA